MGVPSAAGDILRELRRERGRTQGQVAIAAGITEGAVSQFERGHSGPALNTAAKIDAYLDAGGAIVTAFGYVLPTSPEITAQVNSLTVRVEELELLVDVLQGQTDAGVAMRNDALHQLARLESVVWELLEAIPATDEQVAEKLSALAKRFSDKDQVARPRE